MKVYIASRGERGDYSIEGIFSSKDYAQEYINSITWPNSEPNWNPIEEWEVIK